MRRSQIAPGVHLSYDAAQKFNRCRISIHFAFPARRETATAHALLPLVMERGYADCPDMTQMTKKLARLYGADLTVDARPMGCSHNLCVSITGIKDQFALEGEKLTQEYAALALGTAFHPYFVGSTFDPEAVGIEKQMLRKALEDEVNDKRLYCQRQANREFFGDSPAGVRQEGYLEEVDGLTPEALTEAYYEMLRTANIELIVLGCDEASTTAVKDALLDGAFGHRPRPAASGREHRHAPAGAGAEGGALRHHAGQALYAVYAGRAHAPRPDGGGAAGHGAVRRQCDQPPVPERAGTRSFVLLLLVQLPELYREHGCEQRRGARRRGPR